MTNPWEFLLQELLTYLRQEVGQVLAILMFSISSSTGPAHPAELFPLDELQLVTIRDSLLG